MYYANDESTVAYNCHHKIKFVMATLNLKQQIQITCIPSKLQTYTAKTKTITNNYLKLITAQAETLTPKANRSCSVGKLILTALAIQVSNFQHPLAMCSFHSPRKMPPPPPSKKKISPMIQKPYFFFQYLIITEAQLAILHWASLIWFINKMPPP